MRGFSCAKKQAFLRYTRLIARGTSPSPIGSAIEHASGSAALATLLGDSYGVPRQSARQCRNASISALRSPHC